MRLFHRFFLILLAFSMLPIAGLGLWMISARQEMKDNARALHSRLAALVADSGDRMLEQLNRSLVVVEDLERAGGQAKLEIPALRRAAMSDSDVAYISILSPEGRETERMADPEAFPDASPQDRSAEPAFVESRKTNRLTVGEPRPAGNKTVVPVVHPMSDGRSLFVMYSLSGLQRRLARLKQDGRGRVLIVDAKGAPIPGVAGPPPSPTWALPPQDQDWGWWDDIPSPAGPWVAASQRTGPFGWRAVSLQLRREAFAEQEAAAARAGVFFLMLCFVVGLGAYWLSDRLVEPLNALIKAAERVAQGDFSRPVPRLGWGELETLGTNFNAMSERVRHFQSLQVDKLMEEKAKVDALIKNIPEGVLLASPDGSIAFANATAARILGLSAAAGSKTSELTRVPELKRLVDGVSANGKAQTGEINVKSPDGKASAVFAGLAMGIVRDGRPLGILALLRDVTMEKELERVKEEFFHSIVHDLRGPLTVVDGMVHFMKQRKDSLPEREQRYIQLTEDATERLRALISNILDIAKLESGTMKLAPSRFTAEALLSPIRDLLRVPAEQKGIAVDLEGGGAGELQADGELLERVVMNLAGNAIKFTPRGGRIFLGAQAVGGEIEFHVRDTGPGIPADKLQAVFEKFKQLDRDAAARAGYGLGLSICKKIVELHGGKIWVESKEGQGSRFAFRIPRALSAEAAAVSVS